MLRVSGGVRTAEWVGFGAYRWFCDWCFSLAGFGGTVLDEGLLIQELESEQGWRREEDGAAGAEGKVLSTVVGMKGPCMDGVGCKVQVTSTKLSVVTTGVTSLC